MFIADSGNQRVLEYLAPFTTGMSASVVFGQPDLTSSGQNVTQNGMGNPEETAFDGSGNLWSGDFFFGRVIDFVPPFTDGMNASIVIGQQDFTTNGGSSGIPASQSNMNNVVGVAFDGACNLWAGDFDNNRILKFTPPFSDGMNASMVIGQTNYTSGAATTASGRSTATQRSFKRIRTGATSSSSTSTSTPTTERASARAIRPAGPGSSRSSSSSTACWTPGVRWPRGSTPRSTRGSGAARRRPFLETLAEPSHDLRDQHVGLAR
jgi:hypothetical protein